MMSANSTKNEAKAISGSSVNSPKLSKAEWEDLKVLCSIHSTPGDEDDAAAFMLKAWADCGWNTSTLGRYAAVAKSPNWVEGRPTVLLCAHLDSPGFIVQKICEDNNGGIISLGSPHVIGESASVLIKGRDGFFKGTISDGDALNLNMFTLASSEDKYILMPDELIHRGDRICFEPVCRKAKGGLVKATFLDNRVGCWALIQIARKLNAKVQKVNVVLAATAQEEMTGFGADVLAGKLAADVTVCLDATYTDEFQGICLGGGPVLTVCDKSTLLSQEVCKAVEDVFARWQMPLQQEYYNYSGTDSRAFPKQANERPVLALLLATEGNHTQTETASEEDICSYERMCLNFCMDDVALQMIVDAWNSWGAVRVK